MKKRNQPPSGTGAPKQFVEELAEETSGTDAPTEKKSRKKKDSDDLAAPAEESPAPSGIGSDAFVIKPAAVKEKDEKSEKAE